jgi:uncharacterized BrkB/YihY/UPF0761 family membrane protein
MKKILRYALTLLITSAITSLIFTIIAKYFNNKPSWSHTSFYELFLYYNIIITVFQILFCFWVVYKLAIYAISKKISIVFVSVLTGCFTLFIGWLFSYYRLQTYFFDPFKYPYQVWAFFFTGFSYPFVHMFLKKKI